jgi:hypothetical protein
LRNRIARSTGIPTTRSGMERKIGRAAFGGGCLLPCICVVLLAMLAAIIAL